MPAEPKLKVLFMIHVEGETGYTHELAARMGLLATVVGTHNAIVEIEPTVYQHRRAKISLQSEKLFLDDDDDYPGGQTSLTFILSNCGNFWVHCHDGSPTSLQATHACVMSAYAGEAQDFTAANVSAHVQGRSAGAQPGYDWVAITADEGLRHVNSTATPIPNISVRSPGIF